MPELPLINVSNIAILLASFVFGMAVEFAHSRHLAPIFRWPSLGAKIVEAVIILMVWGASLFIVDLAIELIMDDPCRLVTRWSFLANVLGLAIGERIFRWKKREY